MGGRGGGRKRWRMHSFFTSPMKWKRYTVISFDTVRRGEAYPFFDATGRRWSLVSVDLEEECKIEPRHTLGMEQPTLVWYSDNNRKELYVDGMTTAAFCSLTGLDFSLHKGAAVLSKRMSRILRPYRAWGSFDGAGVRVGYLDQEARAAKVWDGAGLIDRRMLAKLPLPEGMSPEEEQAWRRRLMREGRVEFTIQHAMGQDKGHAIVADDLRDDTGRRVDFLLPRDTKKEVTLQGEVFVGVNPVHGKDDLRLDIQSFVNLNAFWGQEAAIDGAREELDLFEAAVVGNRLEDIGMQLQGREEGVGGWPLQEFWEAGGDIRWSPHLIQTVFSQHLKRLEATAKDKVRLPQHGGRYYVMPQGVGQRGGLPLSLARGEIHIDPERATAWVNDTDWLSLSSTNMETYSDGIASILGGADNDDGLWLSPFQDTQDGARKFLVWRSPNQAGEYVVLKPTPNSHIPQWHEKEIWTERDSALLPTRADKQSITYMNMVDHEHTGGMGQGEAYSIHAMHQVQETLQRNEGGLELYCNATLRHVAMYGDLPPVAPARLEDVVDSKKTGADVSGVKQWCYDDTRAALARGDRVPKRLLGRLARPRDRDPLALEPPPLRTTPADAHWLDRFDSDWNTHIQQVKQVRDRLMREAMPPDALFSTVATDPDTLAAGAKFNQTYATTVRRVQRKELGGRQKEITAQVQREVERDLHKMPMSEQRRMVLKQEFDKAWRARAKRVAGRMGEEHYTAAVADATAIVDRLSDAEITVEVRYRLTKQVERRVTEEQAQGLSKEGLEEIRATMEQFLGEWGGEEQQKQVLLGALASVFLSDRNAPGTDADGVWLMGKVRADGTRAPGIAHLTIEALTDLGVMGVDMEQTVLDVLREYHAAGRYD